MRSQVTEHTTDGKGPQAVVSSSTAYPTCQTWRLGPHIRWDLNRLRGISLPLILLKSVFFKTVILHSTLSYFRKA